MTLDFGRNHWLLFGVSFFGFIALAYLVGIGPAIWVQQHSQPLPGAVAPSAIEKAGLEIYIAEGCVYCHTQQVRPLKMDAIWGRPSAPGDYAYVRPSSVWQPYAPAILGSERTGPDLSNVGARQASEVWQYMHLYNPRSVVPDSVMPAFPWLFEVKAAAARANRSCRCRHPTHRREESWCRASTRRRWSRTCWLDARSQSRATAGRADAGRPMRWPPRTRGVGSARRHPRRPRRGGDHGVCRAVSRRPGEPSETHVKRRILEDGTRGIPMTDDQHRETDADRPRDRIDIFIDDAAEPLLSTTPPLSFELDTSTHGGRASCHADRGVRRPRGHGRPHACFQRP